MADDSESEHNPYAHQNQHYDESLDVPEAEDVASIYTPTPRAPKQFSGLGQGQPSRGNTPPKADMSDENSDDEFDTGQPEKNASESLAGPLDLENADMPGKMSVKIVVEDTTVLDHDDDDDDDSDEESGDDNENGVDDDGNEDEDEDDDEDDDEDQINHQQHQSSITQPDQTSTAKQEMSSGTFHDLPTGSHGPPVSNTAMFKPDKFSQSVPPLNAQQEHSSESLKRQKENLVHTLPATQLSQKRPGPAQPTGQLYNEDDDDEEDSGSSEEEDDDEGSGGAVEGAYDPADYEHLPVTPEIKELFQYITRYTTQTIELEHKLKPFIPDFIPAVGDIDAFIKIQRPDGKPDTLGLTVLDEPCARQSDPTVLDLQLRAVSKQTNLKAVVVKSIDEAEKNPKAVDNWIQSISEIHRSRPPPNVHYTKNMPDIDSLMQEWPADFEELLKEVGLPSADIDCDLATYVDMICAILDIPIHKSKIQSLHVLFTLYSEFKNSQHFKSLAVANKLDNEPAGDQDPDTLVL